MKYQSEDSESSSTPEPSRLRHLSSATGLAFATHAMRAQVAQLNVACPIAAFGYQLCHSERHEVDRG